MNCKKTGMTLVEILVVLAIISLLVGVFIPAASMVQETAKRAKQKGQFSAIELALEAFRNDFGDYPPSSNETSDYCGAQKLTEALIGWDMLGFHPKSEFTFDGYNKDGQFLYDTTNEILFDQRKDSYLDSASANVFRLGNISALKPGLYNNTLNLAPDTYVICDAFGRKKIKINNETTVTAGNPILYYKANTTKKTIDGIYNPLDNKAIIDLQELECNREQPLNRINNDDVYEYFFNYIQDHKIQARAWPYRPDSYILISAGVDGIYGTADDIRNFGN